MEEKKYPIRAEHFKLLRTFGRNMKAQQLEDPMKDRLWQLACKTASLPVVPQEEVVKAWRLLVQGESTDSDLAINGDVDPEFTSIAVTYKKRMVASHTTHTDRLLLKLLSIYCRKFNGPAEFEQALLNLAAKAVSISEGNSS
jgi:hypothetical protein